MLSESVVKRKTNFAFTQQIANRKKNFGNTIVGISRFKKSNSLDASNEKKFSAYEAKEQTNKEKIDRRLAALDALYNSTADEEEPEATAKFFKLMDEQKTRRAAAW